MVYQRSGYMGSSHKTSGLETHVVALAYCHLLRYCYTSLCYTGCDYIGSKYRT